MPKIMDKSSDLCHIADIANRLVSAEMVNGLKRPEAEAMVARRAGLSKSSIENLKRGRLKNADTFGGKIRRAFVVMLEKQIALLESELAVARMLDRQIDFDAVQAGIWAAKEALRGK